MKHDQHTFKEEAYVHMYNCIIKIAFTIFMHHLYTFKHMSYVLLNYWSYIL